MSEERQNIPELIAAATGGTLEEASAAAARLAEIGLPALGPVVAALKQSPSYSEGLRNAVRRMGRPETVPALSELLKENDSLLTLVAAEALGRAGDERAVGPLLELFRDEDAFYAARGQAALGLARLRAEQAVPALLDVLKKAARGKKDQESAAFIRQTAVALAMLGNQEGAEAVIALARHRDSAVRDEAAKALRHVVGRGLFPSLQKALRSKSTDLRQEALEALFHLGLRESVEELVAYVKRGDADAPELIDAAVRRLRDLTGEAFGWNVTPVELREWWKQHESRFDRNVCHRLGKPIDLADFVELLATDEEPVRKRLLTELHVITGEEFGLDSYRPIGAQPEVIERALKWLGENADTYERGAVYKYGHKQSLEDITKSPARKKTVRRGKRSES
ncbi:MAG TPA: HEAT repeat domain-containing protein [Pyrinomonadaceae bacterium]